MPRTVLVLAGGVASPAEAKATACEADFILAVDGGFPLAQQAGLRVDLVVGDLDSLDEELPPRTPVVRVPREKEATDLELALDQAVALGAQKILVVGAFGARIDHTLANASLLEKYDLPIVVFHADARVYLVTRSLEIQVHPADLVSLIPLSSEVRGISTWGLRYVLADGTLFRASTRGVSNEVVGTPCGVRVREGKVLLIHIPKGGGQ